MGELLKLGLSLFAKYGAIKLRRLPATVLLLLAGGFTATAAIFCAFTALWIYLLRFVGPVGAPLIVAGVLLLIAIILIASGWRRLHGSRRPPPALAAAEGAIGETKRLLQEHKVAVLLVAAVTGLIFGKGRR